MSIVNEFRELHRQDSILHIGNVWDVQSALAFEKMGYKAIGTSSAAIADTLGYEDGERMSFDELFDIVGAILNRISIPLTVDLEGGYSRNADNIVVNIKQLSELGVVGVNLEDSFVDEKGERHIINSSEFSHTIKSIKNSLARYENDIFLNIRTDCFLIELDNPIIETMARAEKYQQSGADGLFIPCMINEYDIERLVKHISIPVNVMAMPNLPSFSKLKALGVKRLSSGSFTYQKVKKDFGKNLERINKEQAFSPLFE